MVLFNFACSVDFCLTDLSPHKEVTKSILAADHVLGHGRRHIPAARHQIGPKNAAYFWAKIAIIFELDILSKSSELLSIPCVMTIPKSRIWLRWYVWFRFYSINIIRNCFFQKREMFVSGIRNHICHYMEFAQLAWNFCHMVFGPSRPYTEELRLKSAIQYAPCCTTGTSSKPGSRRHYPTP